jgi:Uma2 family endonuclease
MRAIAMAGASRTLPQGLTLDEFLRLPEDKPYLEYIDGRIEAKVSPRSRHSVIQASLCESLNEFAKPARLGRVFPELRCTFAGRSIVPDLVFLLMEHIELTPEGEPVDIVTRPPDIHIEILSPEQGLRGPRSKLAFSVEHGCPLGWLIDPDRRVVEVFRTGRPREALGLGGVLDAGPVLPGFRLGVSELFGWLKI